MRETGRFLALLAVAIFVATFGYAAIADAQCPPDCAADPDIPRHFTILDGSVRPGQTTTIPLWVEKYEPAHIIHLRFELDPAVAEFVGALPGKDIGILGRDGCWNIEADNWVQTANERAYNPGWQLNYLRFGCFTGTNDCGDGISGSIGAYRDLGIQSRYHIADIIIRGNAVGETPIWIDRRCACEPTGGCAPPGSRDSRMSWFPEGICPGEFGGGGAHYCMRDPGTFSVQYVSISAEFLPPPGPSVATLMRLNAMIVVSDDDCDSADDDDCTPIVRNTWGMVKRLYR